MASPQAGSVEPLVTVVIATRGRLPYLKEAVASVLAQRDVTSEVVVVDDASVDATPEWLATCSDSRVRAIRLEHRVERSAARNRGLAAARGRSILFLDDDDVLSGDALAHLSRALLQAPNAFAAVGARTVFDDAGHRRRIPHTRRSILRAAWREVVAGWVAIPGQMLFRTELLRQAGGWNESLRVAEDQELWLRFSPDGLAAFIPELVLENRTHPEPRSRPEAEAVEHTIRERFAARLERSDRGEAERLVEARGELRSASLAFDDGDFRRAARRLVRAFRLSPALLSSPVTGAPLVSSLAKAVVAGALPRRGGLFLRGGLRRLRRLQGRAPSSSGHR